MGTYSVSLLELCRAEGTYPGVNPLLFVQSDRREAGGRGGEAPYIILAAPPKGNLSIMT